MNLSLWRATKLVQDSNKLVRNNYFIYMYCCALWVKQNGCCWFWLWVCEESLFRKIGLSHLSLCPAWASPGRLLWEGLLQSLHTEGRSGAPAMPHLQVQALQLLSRQRAAARALQCHRVLLQQGQWMRLEGRVEATRQTYGSKWHVHQWKRQVCTVQQGLPRRAVSPSLFLGMHGETIFLLHVREISFYLRRCHH